MRELSGMDVYANLAEEQRHRAWDLALYAVNTVELYRSTYAGIQRSLYKKYIKGEYNEEQANKAFYNTVPTVIRLWNRELNDNLRLTEAEKRVVATEIREHYDMDFELYTNGGLIAV